MHAHHFAVFSQKKEKKKMASFGGTNYASGLRIKLESNRPQQTFLCLISMAIRGSCDLWPLLEGTEWWKSLLSKPSTTLLALSATSP